jgi:D-inositol-3-phosphate glycosyltransferase
MRRLAILSFHTSPLTQPGAGDGGGMNVYVRELSIALARAGIECDVYTRAWQKGLPASVRLEPGLYVHHVAAGPPSAVDKRDLPDLVDAFVAGVLARVQADPPDVIHANYWLSGVAGHTLKHELGVPLVSTFHTLARVKAEAAEQEPAQRVAAEAAVIGCSDAILASTPVERDELERLYAAVPERIEIVPPGVDPHAFTPGDRAAAKRALGVDGPVLVFVGRIQPLKGLDIAAGALAELDGRATLLVVGGPSGPDGADELARVRAFLDDAGLGRQVRFFPPQAHHRLRSFYQAADVCLVPSRTESFGLVALEAAACGTPVVAADVGGLRTIVDHGRTGFLVDARDRAAYAACVEKVLGDPSLAAAMSRAAVTTASRYRWANAAGRLRRLFGDLAARQLVECS